MNITERIKNIKSDVEGDDWNGMATLSDVEFVACECITRNRRYEGCNLLTSFVLLTVFAKSKKREQYVLNLMSRLADAERVLA
jgi:hypothetical protein